MLIRPENLCDGYKLGHKDQYPRSTSRVYSNWTARSSRVEGQDGVINFGLQWFLKYYLDEVFFGDFFIDDIETIKERYARRVNNYLGPNKVGTKHIEELWQLGYLPLEFRALPEGTLVPLKVPLFTVENTLPEFFWLTNYIETLLSNALWQPITSATTALRYRKVLESAALATGTALEFVDWQGHDFSFRGMPGLEAAALSGAAHLIFFNGTDTIPAIDLIEDYYGGLVGGSVNATEHSVMCAGEEDGELLTIKRLITEVYPEGIISIVSDTWDFWNVLTFFLPVLKDVILARDGKVVIRPDSGDPVKIICGDPDAPEGSPERKGAVQLLWDVFGGTMTSTNHRLLDSHIGLIYGDSITEARATEITSRLAANGFASGNVVFGIGSFTYQYVTRDTYGQAMKATWVEVNGEARAIFKKPRTDNGMKTSAKGRLAVLRDAVSGQLALINEANPSQEAASLLQPVWSNGYFLRKQTFEEIRKIARANV
jgi:nicotinamide phosphoribosyltransferase